MRSKQEILEEVLDKGYGEIEQSECMEAMTEYAKEVFFGYKQWIYTVVTEGGERMEQLKKLSEEDLFNEFLKTIA